MFANCSCVKVFIVFAKTLKQAEGVEPFPGKYPQNSFL
jgi:hypothetical protein